MLVILEAAERFDQEYPYLHWDALVYKEMPPGITPQEIWFGLKILRKGRRKEVPLSDSSQVPFCFSLTDSMVPALHEIDLKKGKGGNLLYPKEFLVDSLMNEAITSSQLEGASTSRKVADDMLRTGRLPRDRDEQMIFNNYHTMEKILSLKGHPLDKGIILELQKLITEGTLDDSSGAGRLRREKERVVVEDRITHEELHVPPPANELADRLQALCDFANGKTPSYFLHPVIRAIIVHFWLSYDHPFVDGNGRTARALFYWTLLQNGYDYFEYFSISEILLGAPAKYAKAFLYTETDENDLTYFLLHQLEVIERSSQKFTESIETRGRELEEFEKSHPLLNDLNFRQIELLRYTAKHPETPFTIQSHKNTHLIAYDTARQDLLELERKGLLRRRKRGNAFIFFRPR